MFQSPFPDHITHDQEKDFENTEDYKIISFKDFKFSLLIFVLALTSLGIMVIGSAKHSVQGKQMIGLADRACGVGYRLFDRLYVDSESAVGFVRTDDSNASGSTLFGKMLTGDRWIDFGFTTFQPQSLQDSFSTVFCKNLL